MNKTIENIIEQMKSEKIEFDYGIYLISKIDKVTANIIAKEGLSEDDGFLSYY